MLGLLGESVPNKFVKIGLQATLGRANNARPLQKR